MWHCLLSKHYKLIIINMNFVDAHHISGLYGLHIQLACCLLLVAVMFVLLSLLLLMPVILSGYKIESHLCCAYSLHPLAAFKSVLCRKLILTRISSRNTIYCSYSCYHCY